MWPFVSNFFCLTWYFLSWSWFSHMWALPSFCSWIIMCYTDSPHLFILLSDEHLGGSQFLTIVDAWLQTFMCFCVWTQVFTHLGEELCLTFWGPARLLFKVVPHCNFHQQSRRVPVSPQPCQHSLLSVFMVVAILVGVMWVSLIF